MKNEKIGAKMGIKHVVKAQLVSFYDTYKESFGTNIIIVVSNEAFKEQKYGKNVKYLILFYDYE